MKKNAINLIMLIALAVISIGAMAQGGLTPLVNSKHTYTVTPGNAGNTFLWTVVEGVAGTDYTITNGGTASATILWKTAGTYTLRFTETNSLLCSTLKTATVVVSQNTFDVSTSSPTATCNSADGQANYASATATTAITFTIDMTTGNTSWSPNWEFSFTLTPSSGATIANVTASAGTLSGTSTYTVTGIPSALGARTMTITMNVTGNIYNLHTVDFVIDSAKELTYSTPDKDSNDWTATQTIKALPNTSSITTD